MGSRHSSTILKTVLKSAFLLTLTGTAVLGSQNADVKVNAKSDSSLSSELNPVPASYGYFVDHYQENVKTNSTPDTNPAIALFNNTFLTYWNPTTSTKTNASLLQENLDKSIQISNGASQAEIDRSYLTDRRDLRYNLISGFGQYAPAFIKDTNAQTDFNAVPNAPLPAGSPYSSMKWADENATLGSAVKLVDIAEDSTWSGTGTPKAYIKFTRPYRQSDQVKVNPYLKNVMASAAANDYDFPSGHTTAAFETGETLAYLFPERYQQLITRSSEVGYDRVLAGRHSPLAVMGGRVIGTAMTAATLNDPDNKQLMSEAYQDTQKDLSKAQDKSAKDSFSDYQTNLKNYTYRLTYGFSPIGDTTKPMVVPKGAEVLLATRLPYLNATQRREVLYTTGLPSGYPMTDDTEGWGRLNLFKAANGFGEFLSDTTVNMDAKKGGFNAADTWKNNISGKGGLIKEGTGSLSLLGDNSFKGGTTIKAGTLVAENAHALGNGSLNLAGGQLTLSNKSVVVKGSYTQGSQATLKLNANSKLSVSGHAKLGGKVVVKNAKGLKSGVVILKSSKLSGKFAHHSLPKGWHLTYTKHNVKLVK
ncbi:phosphatase PAP2 family protein [Lentilactobacillus parabuchneri]|jgi:autotransporter-associated beta strand protein|uniref:Phosphatase PAP2 family protein n=3 Tax=Lentilactobacillus TaxID=2767893 RepID=A0A844EJU6_9LACO|nr:phosphatase PAP2 family protein [Lentilactobacillus parabuchneri]APR07268.1 Extracellular serine protease precursor [Lentilactobacillus parabuchneri]KRM47378.1 autotransporter-associated beta strand repeat-containing protein [Lentilactobacillus parabuchneri DSM 5707 = NBRC 107865]KRN79935.1 autotransporter-associated beta strand repeat-containing protein [Lentilactobacillus parabuchneri]MBW0222712.1 phosphatase PAP2 family protein [Lentilactobacillus parabuchneri]MBW0245311.1 phosphatase PA